MTWKSEIRKSSTEYNTVNSLMVYLNNVRPTEIVSEVFQQEWADMPDHRKQYMGKFIDVISDGDYRGLWSMLDADNRQRLLDAAMKKY